MASMVVPKQTFVASDGSFRRYSMAPLPRRFTVTVTSDAHVAERWISDHTEMVAELFAPPRRLRIGLAVQWNRGTFGAATVQFCISSNVLVYQISLAERVPGYVRTFLTTTLWDFVSIYPPDEIAARLLHSRHPLQLTSRVFRLRDYLPVGHRNFTVGRLMGTYLGIHGYDIRINAPGYSWNWTVLLNEQVVLASIVPYVASQLSLTLIRVPVVQQIQEIVVVEEVQENAVVVEEVQENAS